jgi:hypothetical protein
MLRRVSECSVEAFTAECNTRFRGSYECFDTHKQCVGKVSFHFQFEQNTLGAVSVPTNKNPKDWGRANVKAVTRKIDVRGHVLLWNLFLVFLWGTPSWSLSKHFRYIPQSVEWLGDLWIAEDLEENGSWPDGGTILVFFLETEKTKELNQVIQWSAENQICYPPTQFSEPTAALNCLILMMQLS